MSNDRHKDKDEYLEGYYGNQLCPQCKHYFLNNGEGTFGCRAFPEGIPLVAKHGHNHHAIIEGQKGDYVYSKVKYEELSPFAQYLDKLRINTK